MAARDELNEQLTRMSPATFPKILRKLALAIEEDGLDVLLEDAYLQGVSLGMLYADFLVGAVEFYADWTGNVEEAYVEPTPEVIEVVTKVAEAVVEDDVLPVVRGDTEEASAQWIVEPKAAWSGKEWASYLSFPEGAKPLDEFLVGKLRLAFVACEEAKVSTDKEAQDKANKAWTMVVARVSAVCLRVCSVKSGEPLLWPCRGWKVGKLTAAVKEVRDAIDFANAPDPEPVKPKNNGNKDLPRNKHGELVVPVTSGHATPYANRSSSGPLSMPKSYHDKERTKAAAKLAAGPPQDLFSTHFGDEDMNH